MNRFKTIPMFFIVIHTLLTVNTFALNAPYLINATPANSHSITLTWRNNDFDATRVLILRKTSNTVWVLKDSVAATVTAYSDSSLQPLTEYSFALLASATGLLSDTSNVLTATTPKESEIFAAPIITVTWTEGQKFITVGFFDSNTTEKGFRLYRKALTESWASIDSIVTIAPDTSGWKSFADSAIADNKWYSYKVQIYNDSQTAFSPETTVYNYVPPKKTKSYVMTKKGSIPAFPISWVERIGDSLYFPEVAAPGDTEISVVDVSIDSSPKFRGYVDPKNIPTWLKGSVVEARVKLASDGIFVHRNGYCIVSRGKTIYLCDSASLLIQDSVIIPAIPWGSRFIGWLNDSCFLASFVAGNLVRLTEFKTTILHFGSGGIDTFPSTISWKNESYMGLSSGTEPWGCYNKTAIFSFNNYAESKYSFYDFSADFSNPLGVSLNITGSFFRDAQSRVFDTSVVFTSTGKNIKTLYAFDIADAHSGPDQSYLGKFDDSNFTCGNVKEIQVDTRENCLYVIGDSGISIYTYIINPPLGIHHPIISRNSPINRISVFHSSRGISFSIIGAKMQSLQVLNAKGQMVHSANIHANETFVWNRRDNSGTTVPVGFYIYRIGTVKNGVITGSMVLVR